MNYKTICPNIDKMCPKVLLLNYKNIWGDFYEKEKYN